MDRIPFNKPYLSGQEIEYIKESVKSGKISGDGIFAQKCHNFFEERYHFKKVLLTTSCTDALEMASILIELQPGDEVILPSFTFVSTANAFVLRGAKLVFVDSRPDYPNIDEDKIEELITPKTRAIVVVHYAGIAVDMDRIMSFATKYNLFVIEDAAQAIDSYYTGKDGVSRPLGSIGHLAVFSFHETKNIMCGEGGLLVINNKKFISRAEIIREKGTNRSAFFRGEIDKYGWVDVGSSFLPSDILNAFLFAQLEHLDQIQKRRKEIWFEYYEGLKPFEEKGVLKLPVIPDYATNNAHMFYVVCRSLKQRSNLIQHLKENEILAVFHYQSLHKSEFYKNKHDGRKLLNSDYYTDCLVRLPMYYELRNEDVKTINRLIAESVDQ